MEGSALCAGTGECEGGDGLVGDGLVGKHGMEGWACEGWACGNEPVGKPRSEWRVMSFEGMGLWGNIGNGRWVCGETQGMGVMSFGGWACRETRGMVNGRKKMATLEINLASNSVYITLAV